VAEQLHTPEDWKPYLHLFEELLERIEKKPWYADGWKAQCRHIPVGNRVIFTLSKDSWCGGAIYFKTRLTNADLEKGSLRIGLHVETSIPEHGINRIVFGKFLLDKSESLMQTWHGYIVKPAHHQKPLHTTIALSKSTLVSRLDEEFSRLQSLGPDIEQAIEAAKRY